MTEEQARGSAAESKPRRRRRAAKAETDAPRRAGKAEAEASAGKPQSDAPAQRQAARRAPDEGGTRPPFVRAQAKYVRSSSRKARLVCEHLRGKSVDEARAILAFTPRAVARDWSKLLDAAVANAEHNHELVGEDLRIREAYADEGPTLKRYRPRAMGRATRIRKRTTHLTITLTPKESS
jgi:ribosomal protein L22